MFYVDITQNIEQNWDVMESWYTIIIIMFEGVFNQWMRLCDKVVFNKIVLIYLVCFDNYLCFFIDWEAIVKLSDDFNGADLRNVCTEAGMFYCGLFNLVNCAGYASVWQKEISHITEWPQYSAR